MTSSRTLLGHCVIALLCSLVVQERVPAQEPFLPLPISQVERDADMLSLGIDLIPSPDGGDFFDGYTILGPDRRTLPAVVLSRFSFRLLVRNDLRLTFGLAYGGFDFFDIYSVIDSSAPGGRPDYGSFVDRFRVRVLPVMLGLEYAPIQTQFTTFLGGSCGLSLNNVEWATQTQRESAGELSRPALNADGVEPDLVARFYAGVDYRFDAAVRKRGVFRGVFVEASYLVLPVRRDYFASIRRQGRGIDPLPPTEVATLGMGGVTLSLGVNLQFSRR